MKKKSRKKKYVWMLWEGATNREANIPFNLRGFYLHGIFDKRKNAELYRQLLTKKIHIAFFPIQRKEIK